MAAYAAEPSTNLSVRIHETSLGTCLNGKSLDKIICTGPDVGDHVNTSGPYSHFLVEWEVCERRKDKSEGKKELNNPERQPNVLSIVAGIESEC
jgi:hypothetical protein